MYVHVPAAWMASLVYAVMALGSAVALIWRHPLADIAAQRRGAARRGLHADLPRHRLAVGRADVGHMVGVGRAAHLGAGAVLPLSRLYRAGERLRRSDARRARGRDPGAGRRRQSADHQILGRLVEHAASAGEHVPPRRPDHRGLDAVAAVHDGAGLHAVLRHVAAGADARYAPVRVCARGADRRALRLRGAMAERIDQFPRDGRLCRVRLAGLRRRAGGAGGVRDRTASPRIAAGRRELARLEHERRRDDAQAAPAVSSCSAGLALLAGAAALVLDAFSDNLVFFYSPTDLATKDVPTGRRLRIGGLVEDGSVHTAADGKSIDVRRHRQGASGRR